MANATKKRPTKKAPKPQQGFLDGMAPESNPKLDKLAHDYRDALDEWEKASVPVKDKYVLLEAAMDEAGLKKYKTPRGVEVKIDMKKKMSCKRDKKDAANA